MSAETLTHKISVGFRFRQWPGARPQGLNLQLVQRPGVVPAAQRLRQPPSVVEPQRQTPNRLKQTNIV